MNTSNTNLYDMIKSKKSREKDTSASSSSSSPNDIINTKRIIIPIPLQRSCSVSTKSKQLQNKKKEHLKPLFEEGDEVYAAYWTDDKRGDTPSWYPGKVKSYREDINDSNGSRREYGPLRLYNIE